MDDLIERCGHQICALPTFFLYCSAAELEKCRVVLNNHLYPEENYQCSIG